MLRFLDSHLSNMASMTDYRMAPKKNDWHGTGTIRPFPARCTISTINMAHTVMITKQKRKDQARALRQVAIMVT